MMDGVGSGELTLTGTAPAIQAEDGLSGNEESQGAGLEQRQSEQAHNHPCGQLSPNVSAHQTKSTSHMLSNASTLTGCPQWTGLESWFPLWWKWFRSADWWCSGLGRHTWLRPGERAPLQYHWSMWGNAADRTERSVSRKIHLWVFRSESEEFYYTCRPRRMHRYHGGTSSMV